jgi:hypothetical protein
MGPGNSAEVVTQASAVPQAQHDTVEMRNQQAQQLLLRRLGNRGRLKKMKQLA